MTPEQLLPCSLEKLRSYDCLEQIDIVCSVFEDSWKNGVQLDLRTCVSWVQPERQYSVLRELIKVERECREFHPPIVVEAPNEFLKFDSRLASTGTSENFDDDTIRTESKPSQLPLYIDRFIIRRFLGRGNYGDVFEAEDTSIHKRVAIKVATHPEKSLRTYSKEAENANKVGHSSIVQIFEIGNWRGLDYLVSELIVGRTLSDFQNVAKLSPVGCATVVSQIANAMSVAHTQGVIHRDLKPSNLMVEAIDRNDDMTEDSALNDAHFEKHRIRILDFGIAKLDSRETKLTMSGDILGTPHYMSPEQAAGQADSLDGRSDIYSMGVILFELLTGRLPFSGPDSVIINSIRTLKPPRVRTIRPDVPVAIDSIVSRCLEVDAANRYQTAKDLANDLEAWVAGRKPLSVARDERRRVAFIVTWIAAICLLIGVGFAATNLFRSAQRQNQLMSDISSASNASPLPSATFLSNWVRQGKLADLATWLERVNEPSNNLVLAEIDNLRLDGDLNENETVRLEFLRICVAGTEPAASDLTNIGLGFLNSIELSQLDAIGTFLRVAPDWTYGLFLSIPSTELEDAKRQYLYRGLANQCKSNGDGKRILDLLKRSETPELPQVLLAAIDTLKQQSIWTTKVTELFHETTLDPNQSNSDLDRIARWKAKCALVAYGLGEMDVVDEVLGASLTPQARNYFIYWLVQTGLSLDPLVDRLDVYKDDWRATGVVAAVNMASPKVVNPEWREKWKNRFQSWYQEHPSANAHTALRILLQKWGMDEFVSEVDSLPTYREIDASRNWYFNSQGIQMNIIRGPIEFLYGKDPIEKTRGRMKKIDYSFAYSDQVINEIQFARFRPERFPNPTDKPAVGIDYFEAIAYCDWLTAQDGLGKGESISWIDETIFNLKFIPGGYRPPATAEWDCFARAGTASSFDYGETGSEYGKAVERGLFFGPICHDHTGGLYLEWAMPATIVNVDSEVAFDTKIHGLWTRCLSVPSYTLRILKSNQAEDTALRVFTIVK